MDEANACCTCQGCGTHPEKEKNDGRKGAVLLAAASASVFAAALLLPIPDAVQTALFWIAYLAAGWEVLLRAGKNLLKGRIFDENFLMALASLGAFWIGKYPEGVAVMLFYQLGEFFQDLAVDRSRHSIEKLMDLRPDRAVRVGAGELTECHPWDIVPGDLILVRPGERIPLDGVVQQGKSRLNTAALTGESRPRGASPGTEVLAGSVNLSGTLTIHVTRPFGESTAAKILELTEHAGKNKARTEQFITRFARVYTPGVVGLAVLVALLPPLLAGGDWNEYIHRALVFLVISCPCALVLSVPMSYFAGIGCASGNGILVKGGNYLEALCSPEIVVFDKTGTLTHGTGMVTSVVPAAMDENTLLDYAAHAEAHSRHPIAKSICGRYGGHIEFGRIGRTEELPGQGIRCVVDDKVILAGNQRLMERAGIEVPAFSQGETPVYFAVDGVYAGSVLIGDTLKEDTAEALNSLKHLGVRRTVMLTGDRCAAGERAGREAGLDEVYAELLPDEKLARLEQLLQEKSRKGKLLYIGDGINDAPVLTRADVGIAMGGLGADAAIEAADVVLMDDRLSRLPQAVMIARKAHSIVVQNIVFIIAVKAIFLTLGGFGLATMWEAVFADVGVSLLAILNALRALITPGGGPVRRMVQPETGKD